VRVGRLEAALTLLRRLPRPSRIEDDLLDLDLLEPLVTGQLFDRQDLLHGGNVTPGSFAGTMLQASQHAMDGRPDQQQAAHRPCRRSATPRAALGPPAGSVTDRLGGRREPAAAAPG